MAKPSDDPIRIWAWINDHGRTNVSFSKPDHDATEYVRADAAPPEGAQGVATVTMLVYSATDRTGMVRWYGSYGDPLPVKRGATLYTHPARDAENAAILDWLETKAVEVRDPLVYGSRHMFYATPDDDDGEEIPSDLRAKVKAAIDAARADGGGGR